MAPILHHDSEGAEAQEGGTAKGDTFLQGGCWTDTLLQDEHFHLFRNTDFAKTSLGPVSDWDTSSRFYTSMLFADSRPACIYWGPEERIAIYNQDFGVLLGALHPKYMGMSFFEGFPEIAEASILSLRQVSAQNEQSSVRTHACILSVTDSSRKLIG